VRNDFNLEIQRLVFIAIICLLVGLITGHLFPVLFLGCAGYIAWTLFQIRQLEYWLQKRRLADIPDASGVWGHIFDHLSREKKRQLKEKQRLKHIINRVETMTSALNDAVVLLNNDDTISWLNKSSRDLLNLKKTDVGVPITNLIRNPLWVQYLHNGDHSLPLTLPSANNIQQRLEFRLNHFGQGESLLIVRDVTRLYRLEQMRKDFVANVSHELRTPLTVILGYLETLDDSMSLDAQWKKPVQQMQQHASRMTTLINDLTMLSILETDDINKKQSAVPLLPLLQMIVDAAKTVSGDKDHTLELICDDSISLIGNDRELHSAFSNLILNAVKYSSPEKAITIKVGNNFTGGIDVKVMDNGYGIEQHHIHRLTERFYRVDSSRSIDTGGTGLGLAIVKHTLARHDARLHISSRINRGSTFTAIFPKERVAGYLADEENSTPINSPE
jgi:two-component system phosphate regulon sensor histidine kinase PhoR